MKTNMKSYYARRAYEMKNIIVQPGQNIKAGVTNKLGKASFGWLRVGFGADAEFYRLPTENGVLDNSCAHIIDEIERQTKSELTAHFHWKRTNKGVIWFDVGSAERECNENDEILMDLWLKSLDEDSET